MKIKINRHTRLAITFCVLILLIGLQQSRAQTKNYLPHFRIGLTDSSYFDGTKLEKGKAVLFIYFLPDCEDCSNFIRALISRMRSFKNVRIVMITNSLLNQVRQFEKEFKLKSFTNLTVGTEGWTAEFQRRFSIEHFPFAVAYNKNGRLIKEFNNQISNQELIRQIINIYQ